MIIVIPLQYLLFPVIKITIFNVISIECTKRAPTVLVALAQGSSCMGEKRTCKKISFLDLIIDLYDVCSLEYLLLELSRDWLLMQECEHDNTSPTFWLLMKSCFG